MNISICISYRGNDTGDIKFSFIKNSVLLRQLLIDNLTFNDIEYSDYGFAIYINVAQFSSIDDIAKRALTGFTKIDYKGYDRFDSTGAIQSFRYDDVIPFERDREHKKYIEEIEECMRSRKPDSSGIIIALKQQINDLKENSEDVLKRHYDALHPTMHI